MYKSYKIFWNHPALRDYRCEFFHKMGRRHDIRFFFTYNSDFLIHFHESYSVSKKKNYTGLFKYFIPFSDVKVLFQGIKSADIFISSFVLNFYTLIGIVFCLLIGKKVIVWEETNNFFTGFPWFIRYRWFEIVQNYIPAFYVMGDIQKQALIKLKVDPSKIFVANEYPGVLYRSILPKPIFLPFDSDTKLVLFIGRLIDVKGVEYLLKAFAFLEKDIDKVGLIIAGDGPLQDKLNKLATEVGIKNIHFTGYISNENEKAFLFQRSSVIVVPSVRIKNMGEGGPLVVLEALSASRPVIGTTAIGSSREFIVDGENGFIVEEKDAQAIYNRMKYLLESKEDFNEKVFASFQKIKGIDYQIEQLEKAIRFVSNGNVEP